MLSLEQVRALEERVERAVAYIGSLREENAELKRRLAEAEAFSDEASTELGEAESARDAALARILELETAFAEAETRAAGAVSTLRAAEERAEEFRRDQARIEEGIVHALQKLDAFEDLILSPPAGPAAEAAPERQRRKPPAASAAAPESGPAENELDIF
jgi:chromosome segregation ATPase